MIKNLLLKIMPSKKYFLFLLFSIGFLSADIPAYSAKYNFDSEEISITGTRTFKKYNNGYEISFEASNLLASMYFSSIFAITNKQVIADSYDIKIKPKFLNRNQSVKFNYDANIIKSSGVNVWQSNIDKEKGIFDPLNVQIMIRTFVKDGIKDFDLNIIDMEAGGSKNYRFIVKGEEECLFEDKKLNCIIVERSRIGSERTVKYYLAKELEYMFTKIIDTSPERTNKLELVRLLSLG